MKKIYAVLGLTACAVTTALAVNEVQKPSQETQVAEKAGMTGGERVAILREQYQQGKFNSLLVKLEADYVSLLKSGRVKEFAEMRQVPDVDQEIQGIAQQFEKRAAALLEKRNDELKALCSGKEQELAIRRVQSLTAPVDEAQSEAMHYLSSLRFKTPEQATTSEERTLIEIDLAHEFKSVHLDVHHPGDRTDLLEQQIVLSMEKMEKMRRAAETFSDSALQAKVLLAAKSFDAWQSRSLDLRELLATVKKPSNELERKIGSVLSSYKAKQDDLYQQEFLAKLDS